MLYFVAAKGVRRITERFVPQKAMAYAEGFYERHGPQALFLARFLPAIRTEMTFVAGYTRMPYRRFLFWDLLGIGVWLTVLTVLGVLFSESVTALLSSYTRLVTVGLWVVLTAAALFILYKLWRMMRRKREPSPVVAGTHAALPAEASGGGTASRQPTGRGT